MDPMKGKWGSSRVDLGYTELFCIPEVTSVFISYCDSVLGDSLVFQKKIEAPNVFDWEYGFALQALLGNRASYPSEGGVSWDSSSCCTDINIHIDLRRVSQGISFDSSRKSSD